ncbi:MAG TPA: PAS domain S-box protein [Desulfobacterales bacterium]|nr:PAS domain S-box protein [Desulfobacterales bacterium]
MPQKNIRNLFLIRKIFLFFSWYFVIELKNNIFSSFLDRRVILKYVVQLFRARLQPCRYFLFCLLLCCSFLFCPPPTRAVEGLPPVAGYHSDQPVQAVAKPPAVHFSPAEEKYMRAKKRITMCVDPDWMPLEEIKNGVHIGMAADYIAIFQKQIPIPITLVPTVNWNESLLYAKSRKCDIFSLAMPTPERRVYMNFTRPYLSIPLVMAARNDMPFVDDITSLIGVKLGVVKGYAFGEILRRHYPKMTLLDVDNVDQGLRYVSIGKLDGFIGTLATVGYTIQKEFPNELKVAGKFDERWQLGIATRNDEPQLLSIFNKVIASLDAREQQYILNHWIPVKFVRGIDYTLLWRVLSVAAIGVFFLLWRNNVLRRYGLRLEEQNKQIREGEERYRAIFNAPNDAIVLHDAHTGGILDVNRGMMEMFGCNYKEALDADMESLSSGEYPFTAKEALQKVQAAMSRGPQTFDWRCRRSDGALFWGEVSLKYVEYGGKACVIAVVRDINERKKLELSLYFTKFAIDQSTDSAFWSREDGRFIYVNEAACRNLGYSRDELLTMTASDIAPQIPPQAWASQWRELREKGAMNVETSYRCKDGRIFPVEVTATFVEYDGNDFNCSIVRDITERKRAEKEMIKVKKLESVGVLAGGIAHDFNNILAAILGNINLALFDDELTVETKHLLAAAEKATIRAKDLTQQLLTFAKGGEPVRETSSLENVIRDSADFVLHGDKVICRYDTPVDLWLVDIDRGQVSQVIQNIVLNASQAMPEGGEIRIVCENIKCREVEPPFAAGQRIVKIAISDSGIGMPNNVLEKIFDPYFSSKQQGSGLGLAICQSIIRKHGGYIAVESTPGVGSTFTIYLAAAERSVEEETAEAPVVEETAHLKILIMDDEEMVSSVTGSMLARLGHEVVFSEDGEECLKCYREAMASGRLFDLVIMDLTIPGGMGGLEAAQRVLELDPGARMIVSSGYSNDPVMAKFRDFGFCAAIVKPYQLQELARIISNV